MAVKLTKRELENIITYRYSTNDWTPLDHVFNPWWEFCVTHVPKVSASLLFLILIVYSYYRKYLQIF